MIPATKPEDSKLWRDSYYHKLFGYKAALEAGRVLKYFEKERPDDIRPRTAIEALKAWSEDKRKLSMKEVRQLSLDAHAAARSVKTDAAKFAAHAAGHAIATWHVPTHALAAFEYVGKAVVAAKNNLKI
jgi:hypothetical protein